ncbi:hypothetical protein FRC12_002966 [Ceratobasidium sp. 428]|nr:hypothetical protein FRC09_008795 [Ceratobasidium sp. 395]KAG8772619.1 hypothetical protein FRC12_002966 [Ceratobasidium sp. 428]
MLSWELALSLVSLSSLAWAQSVDIKIDDAFVFDSGTNLGGIQYFPLNGAWATAIPTNVGQRYNQTLHTSISGGSRSVYFFQGDAVYWFGDKQPGGGVAYVSLDGRTDTVNTTTVGSAAATYQQQLWSKTGLGGGDHQVVISHADDQSGAVSLDYLRVQSSNGTIAPYGAGPGSSAVPAGARIVDDADNMVSYDGGWELVQSSGPISGPEGFFYANTVHRTTQPGATLSFTFTGSGVWYFSDIDTTHGYVQISVDGGPAESVSGYHDPHLAQRLIWSKEKLTFGEHKVTIAHGGTPVQYATLDFFMYLPNDTSSNTNPGSGSSDTPAAGNSAARIREGMAGSGFGFVLFVGAALMLSL